MKRLFNRIVFLLLFYILGFPLVYGSDGSTSKDGKIKGIVVDSENETPIEYATIALFNSNDSSLVTGTITDYIGQFKIEGLVFGTYYLRVTFIGFKELYTDKIVINEDQNSINLNNLYLISLAKELDEFNVVAEKRAVEFKIDKKIINVDKQLTAEGGTAVDVLENVPSVQVDIEGNVTLRGSSGFTVLIDGKPTILDPSDVLRQIPSSSIENIEIITNPSAKYNADGATGIINVITKKNRLDGVSGVASANIGRFGQYGGDFQLNYRVNKFNFTLGADYNIRPRPGFIENNRVTFENDTTKYIDASGNTERDRLSTAILGSIEYSFSKSDYASVSFGYGYWEMNSNSTILYDESSVPQDFNLTYNSLDQVLRGGNYYFADGLYQHNFKPKKSKNESLNDTTSVQKRKGFSSLNEHKIVFMIDYLYRNINEESTNELSDLSDALFSATKNLENGPSDFTQVNVDYTLPLNEERKIEAGLQYRLGSSTDETELWLFNPNTGAIEQIPEFTNTTDYKRNIGAAYGIYGDEYKSFGYQVGLRVEHTYRKISVIDSSVTLNRWDYFPSMHLSYNLKKNQQIMMSYSRRIERPRSWWLEPFITWQDAYNVRQGNPDLNPQYIDSYDIGYSKEFGDHSFYVEGYYLMTHNYITRIQSIYTENVLLTRPQNVGTDYSLGIEAMVNLLLFDWWTMDFSAMLFNYRIKGSYLNIDNTAEVEEIIDRNSTNWNSRLSNTFYLWENGTLQINSRYNSATVAAQSNEEDYFSLDASFRVTFLKKALSANLQARNILGTSVRNSFVEGVDFTSYYSYEPRYPSVVLTLSYKFNNYRNNRRLDNSSGTSNDDF